MIDILAEEMDGTITMEHVYATSVFAAKVRKSIGVTIEPARIEWTSRAECGRQWIR